LVDIGNDVVISGRMARAIWDGVVSFGLVTIPVKLFPAVREREGLAMHLLHAKDMGRVRNNHVCEVDGREVPWSEVVHGYEYERGKYAVVSDEELKALRPASTQTIDIVEFVDAAQIDPVLFDKPYYLAPEKKSRRPYALLRDALEDSGKVGIAKIVLRTKEHLAALKATGDALVIELMRFAEEIVDAGTLDLPSKREPGRAEEKKAALMLIDAMTAPFDAREFKDSFGDELRRLLKARASGQPLPKASAPRPANVVDLVSVLKQSLQAKKNNGMREAHKPRAARKGGAHRSAASSH
jgi:DNA end-binding protein Ku